MQNFIYTVELPSAKNVKRIYSNNLVLFIYSILMHYAYENFVIWYQFKQEGETLYHSSTTKHDAVGSNFGFEPCYNALCCE